MLLVNLAGQPGAGKSTLAAGVFHAMKMRSWDVELIIEYTKELNHQRDFWTLSDELLVFAEKYKRIKKFADVDIVITDSPLQCSMHYGFDRFKDPGRNFFKHVAENSFDSIYFVLQPPEKYNPVGRHPDETDAKMAGEAITSFIRESHSPVWDVPTGVNQIEYVLERVEQLAREKGLVPR